MVREGGCVCAVPDKHSIFQGRVSMFGNFSTTHRYNFMYMPQGDYQLDLLKNRNMWLGDRNCG